MSMMVSFVLSFFPRDVLDEILNLIESVSEDFPSYSYILSRSHCVKYTHKCTYKLQILAFQPIHQEHKKVEYSSLFAIPRSLNLKKTTPTGCEIIRLVNMTFFHNPRKEYFNSLFA